MNLDYNEESINNQKFRQDLLEVIMGGKNRLNRMSSFFKEIRKKGVKIVILTLNSTCGTEQTNNTFIQTPKEDMIYFKLIKMIMGDDFPPEDFLCSFNFSKPLRNLRNGIQGYSEAKGVRLKNYLQGLKGGNKRQRRQQTKTKKRQHTKKRRHPKNTKKGTNRLFKRRF